MLDVRKPLGLLFMILGGLLFWYGVFCSPGVEFHTPGTSFLLKLNQPVGAFMFVFGLIMWQLARFVELHTLDRELRNREKELGDGEKRSEPDTPSEGEVAGRYTRVSGDLPPAATEDQSDATFDDRTAAQEKAADKPQEESTMSNEKADGGNTSEEPSKSEDKQEGYEYGIGSAKLEGKPEKATDSVDQDYVDEKKEDVDSDKRE